MKSWEARVLSCKHVQASLFDNPALEEWRNVPGWGGTYQVSNHGRLRRGQDGRGVGAGKILKQHRSPRGGRYVVLSKGTKNKFQSVHRLVASVFLGSIPPGYEIHHKDGNPGNNMVSNLQIISRADHIEQSKSQIPKGESHYRAKLTADDVREIRRVYKPPVSLGHGRYFYRGPTLHELSDKFGVSYQTINSVVLRKSWKHIK